MFSPRKRDLSLCMSLYQSPLSLSLSHSLILGGRWKFLERMKRRCCRITRQVTSRIDFVWLTNCTGKFVIYQSLTDDGRDTRVSNFVLVSTSAKLWKIKYVESRVVCDWVGLRFPFGVSDGFQSQGHRHETCRVIRVTLAPHTSRGERKEKPEGHKYLGNSIRKEGKLTW